MPRPANAPLIAIQFVKSMDGIGTNVAADLPEDVSGWSSTGFVVVGPVTGGTPDMYVPMGDTVTQIDCYAVNPNSKTPPWGLAYELAEYIRAGTFDNTKTHVPLSLPTGYDSAMVLSSYLVSEPRSIPSDEGDYARVEFDLAFKWLSLG